MKIEDIKTQKTIEDFGQQWSHFTDNTGYYGSTDILKDICGPHFNLENFKQKTIIDIGAGTGRLTNLLIESGAKHVYALEPSKAFDVLLKNTTKNAEKITYLHTTGDNIPNDIHYDFAISIGVIHHIPDPVPTLKSAIMHLKPGGKIIIWLYGKEGNRLYLFFASFIRLITIKIPNNYLIYISKKLVNPLRLYGILCKSFKLPMHEYMKKHINKLDNASLLITIYDQLNPHHAKYYKKDEAFSLLEDRGLINIRIYHRHGYSWTLVGEKNS